MTRDDRDLIRAALDARVRARVAAEGNPRGACSSCGCDLDCYSIGCATCWDRSRRRARRKDPVLAEIDRRKDREQRRRKRARRRAAA